MACLPGEHHEFGLLLFALTAFVSVGIVRVTLAVARRSQPGALTELTPPLSLVVGCLSGMFVMVVVFGGTGYAFFSLAAYITSGNTSPWLAIFGGVAFSAAALCLAWLLWSWLFFVSEGRQSLVGSFRSAAMLTVHHKAISAALVLIAAVLVAIGTLMFTVGLLVTVPLLVLLLAVSYLRMTGQPFDSGVAD